MEVDDLEEEDPKDQLKRLGLAKAVFKIPRPGTMDMDLNETAKGSRDGSKLEYGLGTDKIKSNKINDADLWDADPYMVKTEKKKKSKKTRNLQEEKTMMTLEP